jgi:hypothetical protein
MRIANQFGLTRRLRRHVTALPSAKAALLFLGVLLSGCGPDFDPPDQLHSLRILGVEKDLPYAKPGQTVKLQMLWEDASASAGRPIQIVWSAGCTNPAGDLYYSCFTQPGLLGSMMPGDTPVTGDTTQIAIPDDIISTHAAQTTENNAPYGITFVFFVACAGKLVPVTRTDVTSFPIGCQDDAGNLLGSDDFVAGYTSIYSFQKFTNNNPVISGFEFNGTPLNLTTIPGAYCGGADGPDCTPIAEESTVPTIDCTVMPRDPRCVPTCSDDGKKPCPAYAIRPTVDKTDPLNQDQDDVSVMQLGHPVGEQMWIDYYTDGGGFKSSVRLLNDATTGWNDDYGTDFYAPKDAKASRVWALVHDNRGGVAWAGITVQTY